MKKVLLTTSAIVGLSVPTYAADPTAVSDQPYFHHSHPMTWTGSMSIALTNLSTKDADDAIIKGRKKDYVFSDLFGTAGTDYEEIATGNVGDAASQAAANTAASSLLSHALSVIQTDIAHLTAANFTALEDIVDDYFGGSFSNAYDVMIEASGNTTTVGSNETDLAADLAAFAAAQDAGSEGVEVTSSINTTASLGVSMSAGDDWTASTSGTINLGGGSVSAGAVSLSNGTVTIGVGKSQHSAKAAVTTVFGMDRSLNTNSADSTLSASMAVGGATLSVDNELNGDSLETTNQTVGIKGSYGTMSYGIGWEADGDLGFSIGTTLGGIGLTISRVNTGSTYSTGLGAQVDLGGGMTLNATNAQNSAGLTDVNFNYGALTATYTRATGAFTQDYDGVQDSIGTALLARAVHKSISTVGISYAGGGTSMSVTYQEKAGTSSLGDNLIASGSMAISPSITLNGTYNKDSALTTIGASGPLGSAGTLSAVMTSTGSSSVTASFKF
jgi:hypothetical protein